MKEFHKITIGFVVQKYTTLDNDTMICTEQTFVAGDQVTYEDLEGKVIEVDPNKEVCCPFGMRTPRPIPNTEFERWYASMKRDSGLHLHFRDVLDMNPDYELTFREWAKKYYKEAVDI
jgi:hypothetical protein